MAGNIKGITVEIGGDTTKLTKALSTIKKETNSVQNELKSVERLLKMDPKNTELLAQKQELLAKQIDNTKSNLQKLKDAKEKADNDMKNGADVSAEGYRLLQREIVAAEQKLNDLEKQTNSFTKAGDKLKDVGGKMTDIGKKGMVATGAIVGLGAAGVAAFYELDEGYDTIITKTGATGKVFESLKQSADNVFTKIPTDMNDVGIAVGEVNTRFGVVDETLEELTKQFIEFSTINETDLNNSIGMTNKIMQAWNIDAAQTSNVLGLITVKAQETGISVDTLMNSALENNSVFKEMGLTFEQSIGLMAEFEKNGVNSTTALAGLKKAVVNYAKEGLTMEEGLQKTIDSIKNASNETEALTKAQEIFGAKGAPEMANAIREGRLSVDDLCTSMSQYRNTVTETFEATLDPADKMKVSMNELKLSGAELGSSIQETVAPMLEKFAEIISKLTSWFNGLNDGQQKVIVVIGAIVAAIPPLLIIIGSLISAVGTITGAMAGLNLAFLACPITWIIAGIVALVATFAILWNKCDGFREFWIDLWNNAKEVVGNAINSIAAFFTETLPNAFNAALNFVKENWKLILTFITNPIAGAIAFLYKFNPQFKAWVDNLIASIKNWFSGIRDVGKNLLEGLWNGINDKVDWLKGKVSGVVDKIKSWFTGKDGFDTHSPSKWSKEIGKFIDEGLAIGIKENSYEVSDEFKKMLDDLNLQKDLNLIEEEQYYKELEKIRDNYLEKGTSDWWNYTKEIINYENTLTENLKKDIISEYEEIANVSATKMDDVRNKQQSFADSMKTDNLYEHNVLFSLNGQEFSEDKLKDWEAENAKLEQYNNNLTDTAMRLKNIFGEDDEGYNSIMELLRKNPFGEGGKVLELMRGSDDAELKKFADGWKRNQELTAKIAEDSYKNEAESVQSGFIDILTDKLDELPDEFKTTGETAARFFGEGFMKNLSAILDGIKESISVNLGNMTVGGFAQGLNGVVNNTDNSKTNNISIKVSGNGKSGNDTSLARKIVNAFWLAGEL